MQDVTLNQLVMAPPDTEERAREVSPSPHPAVEG